MAANEKHEYSQPKRCLHISLKEVLGLYQEKYSAEDIAHILYGLSYFHDADKERLPKMVLDIDWRIIRKASKGR